MFTSIRLLRWGYVAGLAAVVILLSRPQPSSAQRALAFPTVPFAQPQPVIGGFAQSVMQTQQMLQLAGRPVGLGAGGGFGGFGGGAGGQAGFGGGFNGFGGGLGGFGGGVGGFGGGLGGFGGGLGGFGGGLGLGGGLGGLGGGLGGFAGGFAGKGLGGFNGGKSL